MESPGGRRFYGNADRVWLGGLIAILGGSIAIQGGHVAILGGLIAHDSVDVS